jgi:hypothetical protein
MPSANETPLPNEAKDNSIDSVSPQDNSPLQVPNPKNSENKSLGGANSDMQVTQLEPNVVKEGMPKPLAQTDIPKEQPNLDSPKPIENVPPQNDPSSTPLPPQNEPTPTPLPPQNEPTPMPLPPQNDPTPTPLPPQNEPSSIPTPEPSSTPLPPQNEPTPTPEPSPTPTPIEQPLAPSLSNEGEGESLAPKVEEPLTNLDKQKCKNLDDALESVYTGLVAEETQGSRQLFAFLNYDVLESMIETPENKAQSGLVFCANTDSSEKHEHKWGTVDELIFEQKIGEDGVDPTIREAFAKHKNLWNIVNGNDEYIDFPFVVYALEKNESNKLQTINDPNRDPVKLSNYGSSETDADEYNNRYCFSLKPISSSNESNPTHLAKRYAMFAWKTRYILNEPKPEPEPEPEQNATPDQKGGLPVSLKDDDQNKKEDIEIFDVHLKSPGPLQLEEKLEEEPHEGKEPELSEEDKDRFENEKLNFPTVYIITKNEQTNNEPIITWGVLHPKQFTAL